jgi:hypothetical protein
MEEFYYNHTSCLHSKHINAIAEAITNVLEQEKGCQRLLRLPELAFDLKQLRDIKIKELPRLLIFGLFCGEEGWTIIKTYPAEFLCIRNTNSDRPRLSELAVQLGCDAFHYRAVRDRNGILLEADADNRIFLSGWKDDEGIYEIDQRNKFYSEQIDLPESCPEFSLLKVPESMQAAMLVNEDPELELKEAEYQKLMVDSNPVDPDAHFQALIALEEIVLQGYAERIDLALAKIIDPSTSFWHEGCYPYSVYGDLLYSAYTKAQELEEKGVKFLYFTFPDNYDLDIHRYQ